MPGDVAPEARQWAGRWTRSYAEQLVNCWAGPMIPRAVGGLVREIRGGGVGGTEYGTEELARKRRRRPIWNPLRPACRKSASSPLQRPTSGQPASSKPVRQGRKGETAQLCRLQKTLEVLGSRRAGRWAGPGLGLKPGARPWLKEEGPQPKVAPGALNAERRGESGEETG